MNCPECSGCMTLPKPYRHVSTVGEAEVVDESVCQPTCVDCGEVCITSGALSLYETRSALEAIRYRRKITGLRLSLPGRPLGFPGLN